MALPGGECHVLPALTLYRGPHAVKPTLGRAVRAEKYGSLQCGLREELKRGEILLGGGAPFLSLSPSVSFCHPRRSDARVECCGDKERGERQGRTQGNGIKQEGKEKSG